MASQPTTGAAERDSHSWQAWPGVALAIRFLAFVLPLASAAFVVRIVSNSLYRGEGAIGLLAWILQAAVIGIAVSLLVDRATRRLLPLAALFSMSLVFPDEAPSRFSVALRTGSTGRLRSSAGRVQPIEPGTDPNQAAAIALGLIADLARHDRLTRGHTERVRAYSDMIGEEMELDDDARIRLSWAGLLHDIGKLTVPEPILNKPGRPNAEEWEVLSSHPAAALGLLGPLADWLGDWVLAATQHHERWDGDGYPAGLAGTDISLAGRIVAVADTYDVITSKRSYKESMSPEAARRELVACSGSQFDPEVVRAFLNVSLGRRWLAGPFASLMNLPFGSVGGVVSPLPAAIAAAAIAVGVGSMPAAPVSDDVLAFASDTTVEVAMPEAEAARAERQVTVAPPSTATSTPLSSAPRATTTTISEPDPSTTTLLDPLATTAPPSTSTSSTTSPTTAPTTAPSTTQNPPTTPAAPSTTTTTTTSTTTAAASRAPAAEPPSSPARMPAPSSSASTPSPPPTTPTTAAAPTTTTSSSAPTTTSTTEPPLGSGVYFLKNNGTGDTRFQWFNDFAMTEPDNVTLPNYDTDLDSAPGQGLLPTTNGFAEFDTRRKQTYLLAVGGEKLNGVVTGEVWVRPADGPEAVTIRAALRDCNMVGSACSTLAEASAETSGTNFVPLGFDFGTIDHSFAKDRLLTIILITEGSSSVDVGFDANDSPSYFSLPLS